MATFTNLTATTAAVANRYVASTNMKVGAYTLANTTPPWTQGGALVTVTHTTVVTTDTLGTVVVVGTDLTGSTRTDTITPIADAVATGTIPFKSITSITGAGWVIAGTNDTLVVGVAAGAIVCGSQGTLYAVVVNTTAASPIVVSDASRTIATLKASIAENTYPFGPQGVDFGGFLKVALTGSNDVTIVHTGTSPASYAL